jgi:hypothetical protein
MAEKGRVVGHREVKRGHLVIGRGQIRYRLNRFHIMLIAIRSGCAGWVERKGVMDRINIGVIYGWC